MEPELHFLHHWCWGSQKCPLLFPSSSGGVYNPVSDQLAGPEEEPSNIPPLELLRFEVAFFGRG